MKLTRRRSFEVKMMIVVIIVVVVMIKLMMMMMVVVVVMIMVVMAVVVVVIRMIYQGRKTAWQCDRRTLTDSSVATCSTDIPSTHRCSLIFTELR